MRNAGYIRQAWLVIVLCLGFGAALAGVQAKLSGKIEQNKLNETVAQVPALVPGAVKADAITIDKKQVFRALDKDGQLVGWVLPTSGQGFADVIELLIGVDAKVTKITGIYVLSQKETPGLGSKITKDNSPWSQQFAGKSAAAPVTVIKAGTPAGNQVMAITGATISSDSVCKIVNETIAAMKDKLVSEAK